MPKKITVISQDYDGCYSIMTPIGSDIELNGQNKAVWEKLRAQGFEDLDKISLTKKIYGELLDNITKDADEVRVYVGSDRQSHALDQANINVNKNGSVFPALIDLCSTRGSLKQPWQFEPLLLADPRDLTKGPYGRRRGEAYQRIINTHLLQLDVTEKTTYFYDNGKAKCSKVPLILNQMWDAYRQNPDATELAFHFIDDRQDLLNDILTKIDPDEIPPNMTLIVSKFDYIGLMMQGNAAPTPASQTTGVTGSGFGFFDSTFKATQMGLVNPAPKVLKGFGL